MSTRKQRFVTYVSNYHDNGVNVTPEGRFFTPVYDIHAGKWVWQEVPRDEVVLVVHDIIILPHEDGETDVTLIEQKYVLVETFRRKSIHDVPTIKPTRDTY